MSLCLCGQASVGATRALRSVSGRRCGFCDVRRIMAGRRASVEAELTQAAQINGVAQDAHRFLRSEEMGRLIFRW